MSPNTAFFGADVELVGPGESAGSFQEIVVKNQKITPVQFH